MLMQYEEMVAEAVYSKITESVNPSVFLRGRRRDRSGSCRCSRKD